METMNCTRSIARLCLLVLVLTSLPTPTLGFSDVRKGVTPFSTAIQSLKDKGVIEGYEDGTFKPTLRLNRAEFLKIIMESRGTETAGKKCFPDVREEWFAKYVCSAQAEGVIDGYPDGTFKPGRQINFAEASKILAKAYGQQIEQYSADWYEPFVRALEGSKAIPLSIETLEQQINRGEIAEMMWRLTEEKTEEPSKGYLNVKYPDVMINMASDEPQQAKSCADLKAFTEEASRENYYGRGIMMMDDVMAVPTMARSNMGVAESGVAQKSFSDTLGWRWGNTETSWTAKSS